MMYISKIKEMHKSKIIFYLIFIGIAASLIWFLPKYRFVHKNPQYCTKLAGNLFYCGTNANLEKLYSMFE